QLASAGSARPNHRPLLVMLRVLGIRGFLTAVPAFHALAEAFPHHRRSLEAPAALVPLARLCGGIDGIVPINRLSPLPPDLHRADIAVNLDGKAPASHRLLLDTSPRRLTELTELAAAAGRVVCGDTVLAHLATAISTPSVLLFGPTSSPDSTPPLHRAWHRVLWPVRRTGPDDAGARQWLLAIPVDRVLDALMSLPAPT